MSSIKGTGSPGKDNQYIGTHPDGLFQQGVIPATEVCHRALMRVVTAAGRLHIVVLSLFL